MDDFNSFVHNNVLLDVQLVKDTYTWTNKRWDFLQIAVRLDRFLISSNWVFGKMCKLQNFYHGQDQIIFQLV